MAWRDAVWTYAQMESAFAQIYLAPKEAQVGPFRGRIKHFQRLGVPMGLRPGRGAKVKYDYAEIFQLLFCFEICCFGVDPVIAVELLMKHWIKPDDPESEIFQNLYEILDEVENKDDVPDMYFLVHPRLIELGWDRSNLGGFGVRRWFRGDQADLVLRNIFGHHPRAAIINFIEVIRNLIEALGKSDGNR